MPTREHTPLGAPIWIDLMTSDTARAQEFYGTVFDWTFESAGPDYGGYINASKDGHPVAGLMFNDPQWNAPGPDVAAPAAPDCWNTYLHTADIEAAAAAAKAAGATGCVEPMEIKDKGWMAQLIDPSGAPFALWQPLEHKGIELIGEAGVPVWYELTTRDFGKAVDFYRGLFGWQVNAVADTVEFRYSTASFDGEDLLGLMDATTCLPEGVPSHWAFYLGSEDVDKTCELVVDNGGTVLQPAQDTPYGRLATVTDPTGAVFKLSSLTA